MVRLTIQQATERFPEAMVLFDSQCPHLAERGDVYFIYRDIGASVFRRDGRLRHRLGSLRARSDKLTKKGDSVWHFDTRVWVKRSFDVSSIDKRYFSTSWSNGRFLYNDPDWSVSVRIAHGPSPFDTFDIKEQDQEYEFFNRQLDMIRPQLYVQADAPNSIELARNIQAYLDAGVIGPEEARDAFYRDRYGIFSDVDE